MVSNASDRMLIDEIMRHNDAALGELYDRYAGTLYSLAMRMLGDPAGAQAVTRDTFTQVWNGADTFDPRRATVATWLIMQAHAAAAALLQRQRTRGREHEGAPHEHGAFPAVQPYIDTTPDREAAGTERRRAVREVWQTLPREARRTLDMAFFQGYSQDEIARLTGEAVDSVAAQLQETLDSLRAVVATLDGDSDP